MFEGISLGILSFFSLGLTFIKLPKWIQRQIVKRKLLADMLGGLFIYLAISTVSKSIIGIFGAIVAGLLIDISLELIPKFWKDKR